MKKLLLFTTAAITGLITYVILIKKHNNLNKNDNFPMKSRSGEHHLTDVFAKAKKYTTS